MRSWFCSMSITSALVLTACSGGATKADNDANANRIAHDRMLCGKYGYDAGSDEFDRCMRTLAERREESASNHSAMAAREKSPSAVPKTCETRNEIIAGGSSYMPKEGAAENCGH